jgi:outer membrane protein assembly factor BamB
MNCVGLSTAGLLLSVLLVLPLVCPQASWADEDSGDEDHGFGQTVFLPADRSILQRLSKAQQLIAEERFGEGVRYLGAILESPEDYFYQPDRSEPIHRSLKSQAHRLIGQMPREGLELYELQYGARAQAMLEEAAGSADPEGLAEVSRRFFHTQAGYEATLLLGMHHLDHGRPLAGALALQRLAEVGRRTEHLEPALSLTLAACWLRSDMPDRGAETIRRLSERYQQGRIEVGQGRAIELPGTSADAAAWLAELVGDKPSEQGRTPKQWTMTRGNPQRNAAVSGGAPLLSVRWRVPNAEHPLLEDSVSYLSRIDQQREVPALPVVHPLAVDNVVLMRSARTLLAIDFNTGKRLWEIPTDDPMDRLVLSDKDMSREYMQMEAGLRQRIWEDATYAKLSSDGELVFSIEDLGLSVGTPNVRHVIINGRRVQNPRWPRPYNRLAAHDIRSGKLIWHVGGDQDDYDLPLAGAFFLGPPLPLMQQVYALAEIKGEIRLLALAADTGELLWSQQLAVVEQNILQDPLRRLSGVSPSYADGVLVCPTSNGAVVAVQLATRSLLWGYQYASNDRNHRNRILAVRVHGYHNPNAASRWEDSTLALADGTVVATPIDSEELHCLNLIDGRLLWKGPREDDLFLACIHRGRIVLVGQQAVRAVKLADGEPAWEGREIPLPDDAIPSGRGFRSGNRYYLPLSTAEVATIDLDEGKLLGRAKSRSGNVPGNLVCYRGRVLSQSSEALESFDQVGPLEAKVAKALEANPDDAEALCLRGEILLDSNQHRDALAALRESYGLEADPRTRELLREALFEGLREDFAAYHDKSASLEPLLDTPTQRATYLRLMASGLQEAGKLREALAHYLKLVEVQGDVGKLELIDRSYSVRWDRRIQVELAALREAAAGDVKRQLDTMVEEQLDEALADGDAAALRRFLDYFGSHPVGHSARSHLISKLIDNGRLLAAELLLTRQARSAGTPEAKGHATALLAEMLLEAERYDDAAACYRQLAGPWAEVACLDGLTGRQLVDRLANDSPIRKRLKPPKPWPIGRVDIDKSSAKRPRAPSFGSFGMNFRGPKTPFFETTSIEFNQNQRLISAFDGLGNRLWQVSLLEDGQRHSFPFNRNLNHVAAQGHLLLVSMGYKVFAINTLARPSPEIAWVQDLSEPVDADGDDPAGAPQNVLNRMRAANPRLNLLRRYGFAANSLGAVTDHYVCCWRFRNCVAVDPITGDLLWMRKDVSPGSQIFGDDEYVVIIPTQKQEDQEVMILRAADGKLAATRPAMEGEVLGNVGRNVLLWKAEPEARELELRDAWQDAPAWPPRRFDSGAVAQLLEDHTIGVYEPEGKLTLLSARDGSLLLEADGLPKQSSLTDVFVFPYRGQYTVVTNAPARGARRPTQAMPGTLYHPIIKGSVFVVDENGTLVGNPVDVTNQHLILNQPDELPMLTFGCQVYERRQNGKSRHTARVFGVDKRTGRVICNEELPKTTNTFSLVGDPETNEIQIGMQQYELTLQFTSEPLDHKVSGAIMRALRRTAERIVEDSFDQMPDPDFDIPGPGLPEAVDKIIEVKVAEEPEEDEADEDEQKKGEAQKPGEANENEGGAKANDVEAADDEGEAGEKADKKPKPKQQAVQGGAIQGNIQAIQGNIIQLRIIQQGNMRIEIRAHKAGQKKNKPEPQPPPKVPLPKPKPDGDKAQRADE